MRPDRSEAAASSHADAAAHANTTPLRGRPHGRGGERVEREGSEAPDVGYVGLLTEVDAYLESRLRTGGRQVGIDPEPIRIPAGAK